MDCIICYIRVGKWLDEEELLPWLLSKGSLQAKPWFFGTSFLFSPLRDNIPHGAYGCSRPGRAVHRLSHYSSGIGLSPQVSFPGYLDRWGRTPRENDYKNQILSFTEILTIKIWMMIYNQKHRNSYEDIIYNEESYQKWSIVTIYLINVDWINFSQFIQYLIVFLMNILQIKRTSIT